MFLRVLHIGLAFLILISSTGITVHKHYCQKELKSMALLVKSEKCEDNHQTSDRQNRFPKLCCKKNQDTNDTPSPSEECPNCEDSVLFLVLDEDFELPQLEFKTFDLKPLIVYPSVDFITSIPSFYTPKFYYQKPPPKTNQSLSILYQSFLC